MSVSVVANRVRPIEQSPMENLPTEMMTHILVNLDLNDLLNCRLVNKKCCFVVDNNIRIEQLAIRSQQDVRFNKHFFALNYHSIGLGYYLHSSNIFLFNCQLVTRYPGYLKHLKRLFIDQHCANQLKTMFSFLSGINQLAQLEQLEIRSIKLTRKETLRNNSLRILAIGESHGERLTLETPALESFSTEDYSLKKFFFNYPQNLRQLSTEQFEELNDPLQNFVNLTILKVRFFEFDSGSTFKIVPANILSLLPNLRELHCKCDVPLDVMGNIMANKVFLRRNDFAFFYHGIRIDNLDELGEWESNDDPDYLRNGDLKENFSWMLAHSSKLAPKLEWITRIIYPDLIGHLGDRIEPAFFNQFLNIQKIIVEKKIKDQATFTRFVGRCKELRRLKLCNSGMSQLFFDRLPHYQPYLERLKIKSSSLPVIDCRFVLKLNNLACFKTDQPIAFELIKQMLDGCEVLHLIEFKLLKKIVRLFTSEECHDMMIEEEDVNFGTQSELIEFLRKLTICVL